MRWRASRSGGEADGIATAVFLRDLRRLGCASSGSNHSFRELARAEINRQWVGTWTVDRDGYVGTQGESLINVARWFPKDICDAS